MKYSGITINTDDLTLGDTLWFRKNEKKLNSNCRAWPYWAGDFRPLSPAITELPPTIGLSAIKFAWASAPLIPIIHNKLLEKLLACGFDECFWFGPVSLAGKIVDWSYRIPKPASQIPVYYSKIKQGTLLARPFGSAPGLDIIISDHLLPLLDGFRDPELEIVSLPNLVST
jgi:hypothetical protein